MMDACRSYQVDRLSDTVGLSHSQQPSRSTRPQSPLVSAVRSWRVVRGDVAMASERFLEPTLECSTDKASIMRKSLVQYPTRGFQMRALLQPKSTSATTVFPDSPRQLKASCVGHVKSDTARTEIHYILNSTAFMKSSNISPPSSNINVWNSLFLINTSISNPMYSARSALKRSSEPTVASLPRVLSYTYLIRDMMSLMRCGDGTKFTRMVYMFWYATVFSFAMSFWSAKT